MSVDPTSLSSPPPDISPQGILTAEEVWNEIGWPVEDNPNAQSYTPLEAIRTTIQRVVRGYTGQALTTIEQSEQPSRWAHLSQREDLDVQAGTGATMAVGEATLPTMYLPFFFRKVLAADGTPLTAVADVHRILQTSPEDWTDYRYERSGHTVYVVPGALSSISVWAIPKVTAVEHTLREAVPEINNQILEAAAEALERRTREAERIEQESLRETP